MQPLTVTFDFKNPHAFLALEPTLAMLAEASLSARWLPLTVSAQQRPAVPDDMGDRGAVHRWHRAVYRINDLRRYARARGFAEDCFSDQRLYDCGSGATAGAGFLWASARHPAAAQTLLQQLFDGFWLGQLNLNNVDAVDEVIRSSTGESFAGSLEDALHEYETLQAELAEQGVFEVPGYLVGEHIYYGRQHLPMVRWHLGGERGDPPAWGRY